MITTLLLGEGMELILSMERETGGVGTLKLKFVMFYFIICATNFHCPSHMRVSSFLVCGNLILDIARYIFFCPLKVLGVSLLVKSTTL